jgi:hypothetical protein
MISTRHLAASALRMAVSGAPDEANDDQGRVI